MQIWLYLILSALVCAYTWFWMRWRRARKLLGDLPTFTNLPFVGNAHKFLFSDPSQLLYDLIDDISTRGEQTKLPFVLWLSSYPIVVLTDPDDVRTVTNAYVDKPFFYRFANTWLGDGLVVASGAVWKQNIKKIGGTFTASVVEGYQDVFNTQAQRLVEALRSRVGSGPFNALHYMERTTMETICRTALGFEDMAQNVVTVEYYQAFSKTLKLLVNRGMNPLLYLDCVYKRTSSFREMKKCTDVIHAVSDSVMNNRKLLREKMKNEEQKKSETDSNGPKFRAIIDILMDMNETGAGMTDSQIKNEVNVVIVGGQETVATTMFFTLLMLGCRKDVQDKLNAELKEIFGDSTRPVSVEDLSRLHYCEAVINETLRLFPPIPGFIRYADREVKLNSCTVPVGSGVAINVLGAGRSTSTWGPDAAEYRPERWLQPNPPADRAAFLVFSFGRRACIGKRYAIALVKTLLTFCVRELEFSSEADKLKLKADIALRPVSGHLIEVRSR